MKLRENLYKIIIVILLLAFWGYLLYPVVFEVNVRPDFSEILAMGTFRARLTRYLQVFLVALLGLLAAAVAIKVCNLHFTRLRLAREKKQIAEQIRLYKQTHKNLSSFTDVITEPFDVVALYGKG